MVELGRSLANWDRGVNGEVRVDGIECAELSDKTVDWAVRGGVAATEDEDAAAGMGLRDREVTAG